MDIDKSIKKSKIFKTVNVIACIILVILACINAMGGSTVIMLLDAASAVVYFRFYFDRKEEIEILKEIKRLNEVGDDKE